YGPQSAFVMYGYRFPGANSEDMRMVEVIDRILSNGTAGLIDLNLKQEQKVLEAYTFVDDMKDYSVHMFYGEPREGQSLDEVRDLINAQLDSIKQGHFPDWLVPAVINNIKYEETKK